MFILPQRVEEVKQFLRVKNKKMKISSKARLIIRWVLTLFGVFFGVYLIYCIRLGYGI